MADMVAGILLLITFIGLIVYCFKGGNLLIGFITTAVLWCIIGLVPLETVVNVVFEQSVESYGKTINFVSTINTNSNLKFKADFDLGDRITCKEEKWGIQIDARITEVTETYQKGAEEIEATFGDSLPTLVDKIRKVR